MLTSTTRFILANFFTPSYRVLGRIQVGSSGMIGLMNDPNSLTIDVTQVSLARLKEPKVITGKPAEVRIVKSRILAVGLSREGDVGPPLVARAGYSRVERFGIRGISEIFELEGKVEWSGRFDLTALLVEGGDFFAVYDAVLRAIMYPDLHLKTPALLINRRTLDILSQFETEPEN